MNDVRDVIANLIVRLNRCPAGRSGWHEFEEVCTDILRFLFVPPLAEPKRQPRTYSGIQRRDAVFPNRNDIAESNWGYLYRRLSASLILFEFKNYDLTEISSEEVNQTRNYLRKDMGRLAIIVCSKPPGDSAHKMRNSVYSEEGKLILFLTKDKLVEMLYIKERGDDPSDVIADLVDLFYLQHE